MSLVAIFIALGALFGLVNKYLLGKAYIYSWIQNNLISPLHLNENIEIERWEVVIPWTVVLTFCIILVGGFIRKSNLYKYISIGYDNKKFLVMFRKNGSKEYVAGKVLCGNCRILLEESEIGKVYCPRCWCNYSSDAIDWIVAAARSKWITGK